MTHDQQQAFDSLLPFCGERAFQSETGKLYDLRNPWTKSGWVYATDGAIAVRVPSIRSIPAIDKPAGIDALGWAHKDVSEWCDLPEVERPFITHGMDLCGVWCSVAYVVLMSMLPDCEVYGSPDENRVLFRFGVDGQGILMELV